MKQCNRFTLFFVVLLTGSITWYSCNDVCSCKKESCPGYSDANLDNWFPYKNGQQLVFADSAGIISNDTIVLTDISASASYEAQRGCLSGGDRGCNESKDISSSQLTVRFSNTTGWDGSVQNSRYALSLYTFNVASDQFDGNGFVNAGSASLFYPALLVSGKNYQNVQVIYNYDTAYQNNKIYEVYIQKNNGLLAYRYYPSGTLFVKK